MIKYIRVTCNRDVQMWGVCTPKKKKNAHSSPNDRKHGEGLMHADNMPDIAEMLGMT